MPVDNKITTSFSIGPTSQNFSGTNFYIGASSGKSEIYTLSMLNNITPILRGLTPQTVVLDGKSDQPNPLYNKHIKHLAVIDSPTSGEKVAVVTTDETERSTIYFLEYPLVPRVLSAKNIHDSTGKIASQITGITPWNISINTISSTSMLGLFAAVNSDAKEEHGSLGTGIAVLAFSEQKIDNKTERVFKQWNANTLISPDDTIRACPLDKESPAIALQHNVEQLIITDMHWNTSLKKLYVTLDVTSGNQLGDGACALVIGTLYKNGLLTFAPAAPHTIFSEKSVDPHTTIIGTGLPNKRISLKKVVTMKTTTHLDYIILVDGSTKGQETIHALPLINVNPSDDLTPPHHTLQGTIAHKNEIPKNRYHKAYPQAFKERILETPALSPDDISCATDPEALVGNGALPQGTSVQKIMTANDAVFVLLADNKTQKSLGIFSSTALFDHQGKIKAWTEWKQLVKTHQSISKFSYEKKTGVFTLVLQDDATAPPTIVKTGWSSSHNNSEELEKTLYNLAQESFSSIDGGIKGIYVDNSIVVATGNKRLVVLDPTTSKTTPVKDIVLSNLGSINCVHVLPFQNNHYIFAGGTSGLAFAKVKLPLKDHEQEIEFRRIGDYSFVKKLLHDGPYFYVLTDSFFDRVILEDFFSDVSSSESFATIATAETLHSSLLLDCIVSEKFCALATNTCLVRIGNGRDIRTVHNPHEALWSPVFPKDSSMPVTRLFALSSTGAPTDCARYNGGTLYALSTSIGKRWGYLYRFSIASLSEENSIIDDATMLPLPDYAIENKPPCFAALGTYVDNFATNGAIFMYAERDFKNKISIKTINFVLKPAFNITLNLTLDSPCVVTHILHNPITGNWLINNGTLHNNE